MERLFLFDYRRSGEWSGIALRKIVEFLLILLRLPCGNSENQSSLSSLSLEFRSFSFSVSVWFVGGERERFQQSDNSHAMTDKGERGRKEGQWPPCEYDITLMPSSHHGPWKY